MSTRRRAYVAIAVVAALGVGIGVWRWTKRSACNGGKVDELVAQLEAADPYQHPRLIAEGLPKVCKLPEFANKHLQLASDDVLEHDQDDREAVRELFTQVCNGDAAALDESWELPGKDRARMLFERCDLGRFELTSEAEYAHHLLIGPGVWAIHQWLLDQGLMAAQAQPLTRAVLTLEAKVYADSLEFFDLPRQPIPPSDIDGLLISADLDEVRFNEMPVAKLVAGGPMPDDRHLMRGLYGSLQDELPKLEAIAEATGSPFEPRVLMAFKGKVHHSTVIDVWVTAARLGIERFAIVVERDAYRFATLPFLPPIVEDEPPPEEEVPYEPGARVREPAERLSVFILDEGYRVLMPGELEERMMPRQPELLRERALELCDPSMIPRVLADSHTPVADFVDVLVALRGPDCGVDGSGDCCFPNVSMEPVAG